MNLAENIFKLTDIRIMTDKMAFVISLCSDDGYTNEIYLNNYFEGLFVEIHSSKFNLFSEKVNDYFVAEVLCETVVSNITEGTKNFMRLWVRLRIGNIVIEQPVDVGNRLIPVAISHRNFFVFTPVSNYEFFFRRNDFDNFSYDNNLISESKDAIVCRNVEFGIDEVKLILLITDSFYSSLNKADCRQLCLVWFDNEKKQSHYFHFQQCCNYDMNYILSKEEMNRLSDVNVQQRNYEWKMSDEKAKEYKLVLSEESHFRWGKLPVNNYYAELRNLNGFLQMKLSNYLAFEIYDVKDDYVIFQYHKRSYDIEILEVIVQRVNTELEYHLPMGIVTDNEQSILFKIHLVIDEIEDLFRTGVYQFWLVIRDGIETIRTLLKIYSNKAITENTYIITQIPYMVIGKHYYNCLFYCDTSCTLKCNINLKIMKSEIRECFLDGDKFKWIISILKEPFFNKNIKVIAETADGFRLNFEQRTIKENKMKAELCLQASKEYLCEVALDQIIYPYIVIGGNEKIKIPVQNNLREVPMEGRETQKFEYFINTSKGEFKRFYGDYKNHSYILGVSSDLQFCVLDKIDFIEESIIFNILVNSELEIDLNTAYLVFENVLDKEQNIIKVESRNSMLIARVHVNDLKIGDYIVYVNTQSGMKSKLNVRSRFEVFFCYNIGKKLLPQEKEENLFINVQEICIFENPKEVERCMHIIEKTQRIEKNRKKVWLIGENYGLSARDNGFAFFEYCMEHRTLEEEVYFVTKNENKDLDNLSKYTDHIVIYDSDEHIKLDYIAEFYIVSHGIRDVMPSLYHNQIGVYRKPVVYLQHGITAMKVIGINNKSYGGSIRKFIVSSEYEKRLLIRSKQFWNYELAVTGFSRFDKLDLKEKSYNGYIWVMPTWRDWLASSPIEFVKSRFYTYYHKLLGDDKVLELLREKKRKLVFSLHIEFEKFKPLFDDLANDVIEITDMHEISISNRINECAMIITDYSSIIFDVVYLNKPVLFFQFDQDTYNLYRGSYINMESDLPGEIAYTYNELIDSFTRALKGGFKIAPLYAERRKKFFDYEDRGNSKRIYQAILELREEVGDEY